MISAAQKKAKENFKKAIAYRKKTGCSLKEAFAHTYGKKVGAVKKAAPKKAAVKKAAPKKNAGFVKTVKLGTKKEVTYTKKSEVKPKKQPVKISGIKKIGNIEEIKKGDILYSSWGYDQTNVDFFLVIKKTRLGVSLIPMGKKIIKFNQTSLTGSVIPSEANYNVKAITRKIKKFNDKISIKIDSYSYAYLWNGQPKSFSNYA